jgi:hypothetical protein
VYLLVGVGILLAFLATLASEVVKTHMLPHAARNDPTSPRPKLSEQRAPDRATPAPGSRRARPRPRQRPGEGARAGFGR